MEKTSKLPGFYRLGVEERLQIIREFAGLTDEEVGILRSGGLAVERANLMIENVVGLMPLPLGIAVNFVINGKEYMIPMAIEEPSVVAAASHAAKLARPTGGFRTSSTEPIMIGQIQVLGAPNPQLARQEILRRKTEIAGAANQVDPVLVSLGGGVKDVNARVINTIRGEMVIVELLVDVRDAMGANAVNTICEKVAPLVEEITNGSVRLRIVSNLATYRIAKATAVYSKEAIGEDTVEGVLDAYAFALADPFRCVTHNKGIMNGVTAIAIATGNDTRALEAGAHAYACRTGTYLPLTRWEKDDSGNLRGSIELPVAVGIVGGMTKVHPVARACLKILGVGSAKELGEVMAAVGLAQNFAALRALSTEGIQRGHMKLHARNLAAMAGATGDLIDRVARVMIEEGRIRFDRAKQLVEELSRGASSS